MPVPPPVPDETGLGRGAGALGAGAGGAGVGAGGLAATGAVTTGAVGVVDAAVVRDEDGELAAARAGAGAATTAAARCGGLGRIFIAGSVPTGATLTIPTAVADEPAAGVTGALRAAAGVSRPLTSTGSRPGAQIERASRPANQSAETWCRNSRECVLTVIPTPNPLPLEPG